MELRTLAEVKSVVEVEKATGAYHQVFRVLGAMCDAVITLNDELCIFGPVNGPGGPGDGPVNGVSKLKALLAYPSSSDILLRPFVEFVKKDDRERFTLYSGPTSRCSHFCMS